MRASRVSACVFAAAASVAGCSGASDAEYAGEVRVSSPELIEISPGVAVIADADEPLFYSDGHYWLYQDGAWFRSDSYRGGFARIDLAIVPERIRSIDQPGLYVQYRRTAGRDSHARAGQVPTRSQRPGPLATPPVSPDPPPGAGVPSTPPPETWQPGDPHHPRNLPGGINPTAPRPTPPVTSPSDTHGTPMPPGPGDQAPERALPPGHDRIFPGQGRTPTGAPPRPEDRAPQVRPDDRGPQEPGDQGLRARPEDRTAPGQRPRGTQPEPDRGEAK
jgi:hypothetical protein